MAGSPGCCTAKGGERMSFRIIRDDLTRVRADAIVNTANPEPVYGNGTDRAVYEAAGTEQLLAARKQIGSMAAGEAAVTPAFALPARYIIHTVGPAWIDGRHGEYEILASCYRESLRLAEELRCESIAFPLISTGVYGFPKAEALRTALGVISDFLEQTEREIDVILVVFNREAFEISSSLHHRIDQYIDEKYVEEKHRQEHAGFPDEWNRRRKPASVSSPSDRKGRQRDSSSSWGMAGDSFSAAREDFPTLPDTADYPDTEAGDIWQDQISAEDAVSGSMDAVASEDHPSAVSFFEELPQWADSSVSPSMMEPSAQVSSGREPKSNILLDTLSRLKEILPFGKPSEQDLEEALRNPGENFQQMLLRLIDERHLTDPQVYKKANIDRKLFSKIRCTPDYKPRKKTVIALAIALELDLRETVELLGRAELAFSPGSRSDLIIEYCIENGIYNILEVNALLFEYEQPLLC